MKTTLFSTDYNQFRTVINQTCAQNVQQHGHITFLYNTKNRIVAAMQAARIDDKGRCQPVSYFISC